LLLAVVVSLGTLEASSRSSQATSPEYRIDAIRYATLPDFPTAVFIASASEDERMDAAFVIWLIRGNNKTILFDSGFHRQTWLDTYEVTDYIRPDRAVELAGVAPDEVTDIIISHAHWDHMGGIDLFPNAMLWIQKGEFDYYTSEAWQPGGLSDVIDAEDVINLVRKNTKGKVRQIDGDNIEIMPGITVYTGARHTYASQYIRIDGENPHVLASDNCYLYRNLEESEPVAITFMESDREGNKTALKRMVSLAGSAARVVPGHDPKQFERFPAEGRIARIN
jgi:glyoxylase-like metal-dependent hydrolase (beta-lactamase superfamily II)